MYNSACICTKMSKIQPLLEPKPQYGEETRQVQTRVQSDQGLSTENREKRNSDVEGEDEVGWPPEKERVQLGSHGCTGDWHGDLGVEKDPCLLKDHRDTSPLSLRVFDKYEQNQ